MSEKDIRRVIDALGGGNDDSLTKWIHEAGIATGDHCHMIIKTAATSMPSTAAAVGMAMHATAQMLVETVQFGERSMDGDADDERAIRSAALQFFIDLVNAELPGSLARPS